jgi:hypothetical protein
VAQAVSGPLCPPMSALFVTEKKQTGWWKNSVAVSESLRLVAQVAALLTRPDWHDNSTSSAAVMQHSVLTTLESRDMAIASDRNRSECNMNRSCKQDYRDEKRDR